jgi:hypothetical protein
MTNQKLTIIILVIVWVAMNPWKLAIWRRKLSKALSRWRHPERTEDAR